MALKFANNAVGRLAVDISATDDAIVLHPGEGALFPALSSGDWFPVTVLRPDDTREIMHCTAISGDVLTVTRARENTSAMEFIANDRVELRATAAVFSSFMFAAGGEIGPITVNGPATVTGAATMNGGVAVNGTMTATAVEATTIKRAGNAVWDAGNFNPATKLNLTGGAMTGTITGVTASMSMSQDSGATQGGFVCRGSGTGDANLAGMAFYNDVYAIKMGVRADGTFGLGGWSRAPWSWYSDPSGNMVAAGNVSAYSDPRLKDNIERIDGALGIIRQLDGVRFTWNDRTQLIGRPGARDIGVLADQVEAVLPEIVGRSIADDGNGGERWRVVAYDKLVPVLIEAVKELAALVEKQGA